MNIKLHINDFIYLKQIFDAGEYFGIIEVENDEGETVQRKVRVTGEHNLLKTDPSMSVKPKFIFL